jgi:hypothetical protein
LIASLNAVLAKSKSPAPDWLLVLVLAARLDDRDLEPGVGIPDPIPDPEGRPGVGIPVLALDILLMVSVGAVLVQGDVVDNGDETVGVDLFLGGVFNDGDRDKRGFLLFLLSRTLAGCPL